MTLDGIRVLLSFLDAPERNCGQVNRVLDDHIKHVAARLDELTNLQVQLKKLRRECRKAHAAKECGILNTLGAPDIRLSPITRGHVIAVSHS